MKNKKYKIYDINFLANNEIEDDDLYWLFETQSLTYSLIIGMFRKAGYNDSSDSIIETVTNDKNWMYNHFWSDSERQSFESRLQKIYMNLYRCGKFEALIKTQNWITLYGLTNSKMKTMKKIYTLED